MVAKMKMTANKMNEVVRNTFLLARQDLMRKLMDDPRKDIDGECGYPDNPTIETYRDYYDREGIATRVVNVWPNESWSVYPEVYEIEDPKKETKFEMAWKEMELQVNPWHFMHRADVLSGIGSFGILFLGMDDGRDFARPIKGINRKGEKVGATESKLLYLRALDESLVRVKKFETDKTNPRYGQPVSYSISFSDPRAMGEGVDSNVVVMEEEEVHWTRVIHIADNRTSSEIFGTPRMKPVINRLYDLRKILGGSGEMFWRGAQPGWAFTTPPEFGTDVEFDSESLAEQWEAYANGLQRYLALTGMEPKSLAPQVADPTAHVEQHMKFITATLEVPMRVFLGSEAGHLASTQDTVNWNRRLFRRQRVYIDPMMIQPFGKRLIMAGALPRVKRFYTAWEDINTMTNKEKADVSLKKAQALLQYVTSGAEKVMPVMYFLTEVMGIPVTRAAAIMAAAKKSENITKDVWQKNTNAGAGPSARPDATGKTPRNALGGPRSKPKISFRR